MVLAMALLVVNDTCFKLASQDLGMFQAIFLRGTFISLVLTMALVVKGVKPQKPKDLPGALWIRTVGEVGATICFLLALINMPIGAVSAVLQFVPLSVTLAAVVIFRETVRWPRYLAIVGGLVGVMMIVQPGTSGFSPYALIAFGAVACVTVRDIATRALPGVTHSLVVAWLTALAIWVLGGVGLILGAEWRTVTLPGAAYLLGAGVCLIAEYLLLIVTMRIGEVSFVSPFRYTLLPWAIVSQILIFAEMPDRWSVAGAVLIVAMGLLAYRVERHGSPVPAPAGQQRPVRQGRC